MDHKVWMYLAYLIVSIALTVWVATTLSRNGLVFLEDVFADSRLARAVNQLLVMGFYLLNLGFVAVAMRSDARVPDAARALETLSYKIGFVLLVLGVLHVCNVFFLGRYRRGRLRQQQGMPPLPPAGRLPMYPPPGGPQGPGGGGHGGGARGMGAPGGPVGVGGVAGPPLAGPPLAGPPPAGAASPAEPRGMASHSTAGQGMTGPAFTGPGATGPGATGPGATGPGAAGPGAAGPGAAGPGRPGPGGAGLGDWPGQGMAGPVPPPAPA